MPNLDDVLIQVYGELNSMRVSSTEDITCDPDYRHPFLELVHSQIPDLSEAMAMRPSGATARTAADEPSRTDRVGIEPWSTRPPRRVDRPERFETGSDTVASLARGLSRRR